MENQLTKPKYGMLQAPLLAFFSKDLYGAVATSWTGTGILYIFLLVLVSWTVTSLSTGLVIGRATSNKDLKALCAQVPTMSFDGGKLAIDKPWPYTIKDEKTQTVIAVFVKEHQGMELKDEEPPIVLTPDYMLVKEQHDPLSFADLNKLVPGLKFSGADLNAAMEGAALTVSLLLFFLGIIPIFVGHLFVLLIYGGIEMAMASAMQAAVTFGTAMRLAAVAMTPTILLSTMLTVVTALVPSTGSLLPQWWWISVALSIGFLVLAATGAKSATEAAG